MISATILTGFNDNAAITYLASLVPDFSTTLKYSVMAGAVTGGGLTIIANAPNPVGQAILRDEFGEGGVSPLGLFLAAIIPTLVVGSCFMLLR
jgi:Na+/H+ antiporter NhaD/arsenite permease-like protein